MQGLLERFLRYVTIHTQSDDCTRLTPSTAGQLEFATILVDELKSMGLMDAHVDSNGYVMATIPANTDVKVPVIGFIAHLDTSPDFNGLHVKPRVVSAYDGSEIILNKSKDIILKTTDFPEVLNYIGQDIIVTDGTTLLGADDKAGVAEIMTAADYLIKNPDIKHGTIRICFTPDEEIGEGANHFDVTQFGADFAYTMDGSEIGELEYENFNAAGAKITVCGRSVHPGYAKGKMLNSLLVAHELMALFPSDETPTHTDRLDGFFHLLSFHGDVEKSELEYIIRDFDRDKFESRKALLAQLVNTINQKYGANTVVLELKDQYFNMREKIEPVMQIIDLAKQAMEQVGVKPIIKPIRGGTDGARLSFMGLPCPNIFAGGHNFHGRYEFVPLQSMQKAVEVIVKIAQLNLQNNL